MRSLLVKIFKVVHSLTDNEILKDIWITALQIIIFVGKA